MEKELSAIGEWASTLEYSDIPSDVTRKAELQIANILAATVAGSRSPESIQKHPLKGYINTNDEDIHTAAFINAANSMAHDYDDYLFMGHTGHSAVHASLVTAEKHELTGKELIELVVAANEIEGRLGASVAMGPHNGQMWSFIHQAGAAAVSSIPNGNPDQTGNAVGLSLYNPNYTYEAGFIDGDSKKFTAAMPLVNGLRAGDAALGGAEASPRALKNFHDSYAFLAFPEMLGGLGESWVTRTLCFKPRPGCAYVQAPLEALESVMTEEGLDPEEIQGVDVGVSLLSVGMDCLSDEYRSDTRLTPVNANFSVPYTLSMYLVNKGVEPEAFTKDFITGNLEDLHGYAGKVDVTHDWELTIDVLRGMGRGVDFGPLIRDKGRLRFLSGFKAMRDELPDIPTGREAIRLLGSGNTLDLIRSMSSSLNWSEFNIGMADFEELEFRFGASMEVHTDSSTHREEIRNHMGSSGRPIEETEQVVRDKLKREAGDFFDAIENLERLNASDLIDSIESLD